MKRFLVIVVSALFSSLVLAVPPFDKELALLVDVVKMLRSTSESDYAKASQILASDVRWTPMNETGAVRPEECKPSDKVAGFKLNRILSKADRGRKYVSTHGDMINGEDSRYDYSLYERSLKAKSKAEYALKGRKGRQTFVVIPYHPSALRQIAVDVSGQNVQPIYDAQNGTVTITCDAAGNEVRLIVENKSSQPQSFVIINHNSRK